MTAPTPQQFIQGQGTVSADNLNTFVQTVTNITQLRLIIGLPGMQILLEGLVTPGDGGAGPFYWNTTSIGPDNGTSIIVPQSGVPGAWIRLSISQTSIVTLSNIASLESFSGGSAASVVYLEGYYTLNDGGEGIFVYDPTDVTSASNGGTIIIDGANNRYYRETDGQAYSVKWFGVTGNGTTNDSTKIQNTINAASIIGVSGVYFPAGTYLCSGLTISEANNMVFFGISPGNEAAGGSVLLSSSLTTNLITITSLSGIFINDLSFTSSTTMTTASFVEFNGCNQCGMNNFSMTNGYNPLVLLNTGACWFTRAEIRNFNQNGVTINGSEDYYFTNIIMDQDNDLYTPSAGFYVPESAGSFVLTNSDILHCNNGLLVNPGPGQIVSWIYMSNVFFDTANFTNSGGNGIRITPTGGGIVNGLTFVNCWTSTATIGFYAVGDASSTLSDIQITNHRALNNYDQGMWFDYCDHINIVNPAIMGNSMATPGSSGTPGLFVASNCKSISVVGGFSGEAETYGVTQSYGILVNSGFTGIITVLGVNLRGNAIAGFLNGGTAAAGSWISNCPGWNPLGTVTVVVGSSPFSYTPNASLAMENISLYGGTGVSATIGGIEIVNQSPSSFLVYPGQTAIITYSTAPTMISNRS